MYEKMIRGEDGLIMQRTKALIRLYILEGYNFAKKDIGSESDPYLVITCGQKTFNERENYQLDTSNPSFFKMYEFDVDFPGVPCISIKAFDYDDLFGDDLIGETRIDLDERFFSPEFMSLKHKPIETRQLNHQSTSGP